jgi:type I restriction enzyme R subunit
LLKEFHLDPKKERQIRKSFGKLDQQPKILIVTEKLLTGFDAPVLYAMYLDKPMRDHTLLQAIARVNRPYENEAQEMVKPHGFVLDFVGIFDKLEKALAFDSDEINAIVKDMKLLKVLFKNKMESKAPDYLGLIERNFNDKDVDTLIEHFRDPNGARNSSRSTRRSRCSTRSSRPMPSCARTSTTTERLIGDLSGGAQGLHQDRDGRPRLPGQDQPSGAAEGRQLWRGPLGEILEIDGNTIELIKNKGGGDGTKVINLIKSIEKLAEEGSDDPCLIAMAERARAVQESFEKRQTSTAEALAELLREVEGNESEEEGAGRKIFRWPDLFCLPQPAGCED